MTVRVECVRDALVGLSLAIAAGFCSGSAQAHAGHDPHAAHANAGAAATRSVADYRLPRVKLVRADGVPVEFPADIDDGRPVMMNFVYTTCTAICPAMTQIFAEVQKRLGPDAAKLRMVSLSIDPEQDTPKRLAEYARASGAGAQWSFYTGTVEASVAVQKGFAAYRGDKMNHTPLTLLRAAPGKPWVRIDGFATPDDLLREVRALIDPR
jgi:protein SCO1